MKGPGEKPYFLDHASTLWLASENQKPLNNNGLNPLGWSTINVLPYEDDAMLIEKEQNYQKKRKIFLDMEKARQKEFLEKQKIEAQQLRVRQQEEEAIKKAEKEKQEKLADMSDEERAIYDISNIHEITENRVVEIYNKIDEFPDENKTGVALALKSYWEKHDKWKKKKCSKKQWIKVQKIKEVLGEK